MSRVVLCGLVAWAGLTGAAIAQNPRLVPTYGTVTVAAQDRQQIEVQAGGWNDPSRLVEYPCQGLVADPPDVRFRYAASAEALAVSVRSSGETTLLLNDPAGGWHCSDGKVPSLTWEEAPEGVYDVWVGYRQRTVDGVFPATVSIVSGDLVAQDPVIVMFDWQTAALTDQTRKQLAPTIAAGRSDGASVTIEAHADIAEGDVDAASETDYLRNDPVFQRADAEVLLDTSRRRAGVVRDYLVSQGVPEEAITIVPFGHARPAAEGPSPRNRRVEVRAVTIGSPTG